MAKTNPLAALRADLEGYASKREQLLERRAIVVSAPRPQSETEGDIDTLVAQAATIAPSLTGLAQSANDLVEVRLELANIGRGPHSPSAFGLLAAVFPAETKAWLRSSLEQAYDHLPAPLTATERTRCLVQLDGEIAVLERAWADRWWAAIEDGVTLPLPTVSAAAMLGLEP